MGQLEPRRGDGASHTTIAPQCLSCGTQMDLGYMPKLAGSSGSWIAGAPPEAFLQSLAALGSEPPEAHLVLAYRCARCGLVLHYAP